MTRRSARQWLRAGLLAGAAVAVAYAWLRSRTGFDGSRPNLDCSRTDLDRSRPNLDRSRPDLDRSRPDLEAERPLTERHADAFLVDRLIDPARVDDVADHVSDALVGSRSDRLLGLEGASTASLFLDRGGDGPRLRWYVEVPRPVVAAWDDPESTVDGSVPVSHDALSRPDEPAARELLVHAVHPERPRTIATDGSGQTIVVGPGDATVDVALVELRLESGLPERLADWFAAVSRRTIAGDLDLRRIEGWSLAMLEAESMYTESVLLERGPDDYRLAQYMEAAEMRQVYDAYYDTRNPVARASERVLGCVLKEPARILEYPTAADVELLAHAIDPDRPRRPQECLDSGRNRE